MQSNLLQAKEPDLPKGTDEEGDYYGIGSVEELYKFVKFMEDFQSPVGVRYKLTADIDMQGNSYVSQPTRGSFECTFDGGGTQSRTSISMKMIVKRLVSFGS